MLLEVFVSFTTDRELCTRYPQIDALLKSAPGRYGPVERQIKVGSLQIPMPAGLQLRVFAKSSTGSQGQSLRMWEDVVEPGLQSALLVQVCSATDNGSSVQP